MKLVKLFLAFLTITMFLNVGTVHADSFAGDACKGIGSALNSGTNGCPSSTANGVKNTAREVVNILSYVIGIVSIIMILIAGFRYIISAGDSNATASAKNTLIYALVGIVIAIFAQIMVHWVLVTANKVSTGDINKHTSLSIYG